MNAIKLGQDICPTPGATLRKMAPSFGPGLTHAGAWLAVGGVGAVGPGSGRHLKMLPRENEPLREQPHPREFPGHHQMCLNVSWVCVSFAPESCFLVVTELTTWGHKPR